MIRSETEMKSHSYKNLLENISTGLSQALTKYTCQLITCIKVGQNVWRHGSARHIYFWTTDKSKIGHAGLHIICRSSDDNQLFSLLVSLV